MRAGEVEDCKEGSACLSYPHATGLQPLWGSPGSQLHSNCCTTAMKPLRRGRYPPAEMLSSQRPSSSCQFGKMGSSTCPKALTQRVQDEAVRLQKSFPSLVLQLSDLWSRGLCCEYAGERVGAILLPTTLWLCPEFL